MPNHLATAFENSAGRNQRITELMNACRHGYRTIIVVAVGCGDAFITRYLDAMEQLIHLDRMKLFVADKCPLQDLIASKLESAKSSGDERGFEKLKAQYGKFKAMLQQRPYDVAYLNLCDRNDLEWYQRISADIVFVLVPDDIHVQCAEGWIRRATMVIVEKPYDRDVISTMDLEDQLRKITRSTGDYPTTRVVCIDHYLAKIAEWVLHRDSNNALDRQVGTIKRIEFSLCEAGEVESWRKDALQAGMVYDLFCHILAQVSHSIDLTSFLKRIREPGSSILVSRHEGCPIDTESYAFFNLPHLYDHQQREVGLRGCIGKGVGSQDTKFLRIVGERGELFANFSPGASKNLTLKTSQGTEARLFAIGQGHPEMLDAIFKGHFMEEPVGGLDGSTAVNILKILASLRSKIWRVVSLMAEKTYPIGTEPDVINQSAVPICSDESIDNGGL